jgi:exodeoxyribonuclease VII large subunit
MAVPRRIDLLATVRADADTLLRVMSRLITERQARIETLEAKLGEPARLLDVHMQRLDHLGDNLGRVIRSIFTRHEAALQTLAGKIRSPEARAAEAGRLLALHAESLMRVGSKLLHEPRRTLSHAGAMLESLSFKSVLNRGFTIIRDESGKAVMDAGAVHSGAALTVQFRDDKTLSVCAEGKKNPARPKKNPTQGVDQGKLF